MIPITGSPTDAATLAIDLGRLHETEPVPPPASL